MARGPLVSYIYRHSKKTPEFKTDIHLDGEVNGGRLLHKTTTKTVASFSGGKDSTATVHDLDKRFAREDMQSQFCFNPEDKLQGAMA